MSELSRRSSKLVPQPKQVVIQVPGNDEPLIVSNPAAAPPIIVIPIGIPAYGLPGGTKDTPATETAGADVMTLADFRDLLRAEIAYVIALSSPSGTGNSKAAETLLVELLKSRLDDMQRKLDEMARAKAADTRLTEHLKSRLRRHAAKTRRDCQGRRRYAASRASRLRALRPRFLARIPIPRTPALYGHPS